jgi:hypothetical protein
VKCGKGGVAATRGHPSDVHGCPAAAIRFAKEHTIADCAAAKQCPVTFMCSNGL